MTGLHLPAHFAPQSTLSARLAVTHSLVQAGVLAALVEADAYPRSGVLRIEGLRANRHYLIQGTADRFHRTDDDGTAWVELALTEPTLLLLSPVV